MSDSHNSNSILANTKPGRRHIPSASSALIIGGVLGLLQAIFLISVAKPALNIMGVKSVSNLCKNQVYIFKIHYSYLISFVGIRYRDTLRWLILAYVGFTYAKPCNTVLDIEVYRCSSCSSLAGHARCLPWI